MKKGKKQVVCYALLKFRLSNGLTQSMMARALGCTPEQISKWERGMVRVSRLREKAIWDFLKKNTVLLGSVTS